MKTAGYDIALLLNERFLNELSGAFYYGGFMTINGTADFYKGTITLEHQVEALQQELTVIDKPKVPRALQPYLLMDFRFKLTREPMINFFQKAAGQPGIQLSLGCRIYFFMWQGIEVKFDAEITMTVPIHIDPADLKLVVDFKNASVDQFAIRLGDRIQEDLRLVLDRALDMYFANERISQRIELPCISAVVKDIKGYIQPGKDEEGNDLGILPITVDGIRVVSDTVMALGINLMGYQGGNPDQLHDFARNCSLGIAVSEKCMQKVYQYVWEHSTFVDIFANERRSIVLIKDPASAEISVSGSVDTRGFNEFWNDVNSVLVSVQRLATQVLSGGFFEGSISVSDINIVYGVDVKINRMPQFDLMGDNVVRIYDLDMSITLGVNISALFCDELQLDTSWFIPDSWTPWDDDVTIAKRYHRVALFNGSLYIPKINVLDCQGQISWNEPNQSLELKVVSLDLEWSLKGSGSPFELFPDSFINWLSDILEKEIVKRLKPRSISPKLSFKVPYLPWPLKIAGRRLEVTDSEAVVSLDLTFNMFDKDVRPVPKYIVNINNREIHKIGCDSVNDTYEVHQRSYHLLNDALNRGYDGCRKCLPAFHSR